MKVIDVYLEEELISQEYLLSWNVYVKIYFLIEVSTIRLQNRLKSTTSYSHSALNMTLCQTSVLTIFPHQVDIIYAN